MKDNSQYDPENHTEGYIHRPRGILKLRENTTLPIVSNSERRVSFYSQVELRQFEFAPDADSSDENGETSDVPEVLSSEFDENPDDSGTTKISDPDLDESVHDDESMELTGQLSLLAAISTEIPIEAPTKGPTDVATEIPASFTSSKVHELVNNEVTAGSETVTVEDKELGSLPGFKLLQDSNELQDSMTSPKKQVTQENQQILNKLESHQYQQLAYQQQSIKEKNPPNQVSSTDPPSTDPPSIEVPEAGFTEIPENQLNKNGHAHIDLEASNNISFTLSPYTDRQILFVPSVLTEHDVQMRNPTVGHEANVKSPVKLPLQSVADADSLGDSLFNESENGPQDLKETNLPVDEQASKPDVPSVTEEDMELTEHGAHFSLAWGEELTMELTSRLSKLTKIPVNDYILRPAFSSGLNSNDSSSKKEQVLDNSSHGSNPKDQENDDVSQKEQYPSDGIEVTMDLTQPHSVRSKVTTLFVPSQSSDEQISSGNSLVSPGNDSPIQHTKNDPELPENPSPSDSIYLGIRPSQESPTETKSNTDLEYSMELTSVYHQEAHMLSVVEEEDENETPMELTQPVQQASTTHLQRPLLESLTPPQNQKNNSIILSDENRKVSESLSEGLNSHNPVDTPVLIASQQKLNRLIEEPTPSPPPSGRTMGVLGTPLKESSQGHRKDSTASPSDVKAGAETPFDLSPNHLQFPNDNSPKVMIGRKSAKRGLDPAIELKSSPLKKLTILKYSDQTRNNDVAITLNKFLNDIDVRFFDDLEFASYLPGTDTLHEAEPSATYPKTDFYKATLQVPLLEFYESTCKELNLKIQQGNDIHADLQHKSAQEVPDVLRKYYNCSYYEQMSMKTKFQIIRNYTREQARQIWYRWRLELFQSVFETVNINLTSLKQDKQMIETRLALLDEKLLVLRQQVKNTRDNITLFKKIREWYDRIDTNDIKTLRAQLMELGGRLSSLKKELSAEQGLLRDIEGRIEAHQIAISTVHKRIDDSKLGLLKLKSFTDDELSELSVESQIIQACAGLKFLKHASANIYEFEFNPKLRVSIDINNADSPLGLIFDYIKSSTDIFHHEKLVQYCQAFANTTPFLDIFKTLATFRAKWLRLVAIDEQMYALSVMYPITVGEYNEEQINFVLRYYSELSAIRVDFHVSISVRDILAMPTKMIVVAKILRSKNKLTLEDLHEAICKRSATHRIFSGISATQILIQ